MKRYWLIFCFILFLPALLSAGKLTISGYVINSATGETVIGVNIVVRGTNRGAASDGNGFFVIPGLNPGRYQLDFMHIAFEKKSLWVSLTNKSLFLAEIAIQPKVIELQDVSIVAERAELADLKLETGHRAITAEAIRRIPSSRNDVFRALKFLPGIEAIDPISPLYVVRGSDTGENLILLDDVPIYNPYHFSSASGLFNVYAIKNVELMVGGFGVEYGGRNGSVLYITTREGNNRRLHGEISPGTTATNAVVDFPVGKNATMMLSARYYYDLFTRFLFDAPSYFYDFNGTVTWKIGSRHRLALRYFHSRDFVDFKSETYFNYLATTFETDIFDNYRFNYQTRWTNRAASAVLKTILTPKIFWQSRISYSAFDARNLSLIDYRYQKQADQDIKLFMETDIRGRIHDVGFKSKLEVNLRTWNELKLGVEYDNYYFENDVLLNGYSGGKLRHRPDLIAGFLEDKINVGSLALRPGVRVSRFGQRHQWDRELRINAALQLRPGIRLKAAHGQYLQYIVSINTQEYELSQFLDTYYPLGKLAPAMSQQSIFGIETTLAQGIRCSIDFYYKNITRCYAYDYNASQMEAGSFVEKLRQGSGKSYGLEILIKGYWGKSSGWISYGWSRSTRRFPHIMNNKSFLFDYDRPHSFKAVINHQLTPAVEFSGALRILSGMPRTLESGYASYFYYDPVSNALAEWYQVLTPVKNNIRMPYYLRLDFGIKKRLRKGFGAEFARYLGARRAFINVTFGNLLFALQRNVWFYIRTNDRLYGVGTNYIPEFSMGYSIQF